ncbi:organic cation transporter-like protein [Neocloeon triangulifer]|uniref:organic cation transporter-like protein n=1 Tax=Neocloeon triangulifer TaxID=2078957 RepID=UPI00286EF3E6|nr:organic cation transporter-like protein [Neocloeon triangulifer]
MPSSTQPPALLLWHQRPAVRFFLLGLSKVAAGWHMLSVLYLAPRPETFGGRFWCARPQPALTSYKSGSPLDDPCQGNVAVHYLNGSNASFEYFSECKEFHFEIIKPTMVSEWSLVCSRDFLVNVVQLGYLLGIFAGGFATASLQQRFSPRILFVVAVLLQVLAGVGSALVPTFEMHFVLKMFTGLGVCITFTVAFNSISQQHSRFGPDELLGVMFEHWWSVGVISLGWLHQLAPSWRVLQLMISLPSLLLLLTYWVLPQKSNLCSLLGTEETEVLTYNKQSKKVISFVWWHYWCLQVMWLVTIFNYYGALLNLKNVSAKIPLPVRTTLAGVAEMLGATVGLFILLQRGKSQFNFLSVLLFAGGSSCVLTWPFLLKGIGSDWTILVMVLAGRVAIACSMAILQNGVSVDPEVGLVLLSSGRLFLQAAPFSNSMFAKWGRLPASSFYGMLCLVAAISALLMAKSTEWRSCQPTHRRMPNCVLATNLSSKNFCERCSSAKDSLQNVPFSQET